MRTRTPWKPFQKGGGYTLRMSKVRFTDGQWAIIQPLLLPRAKTGRPRADDRRTLEGILYVQRSRCRWRDLPRRYGAPTTVWRRLKTWQEDGTWLRLWRTVLGRLDAQGRLDWRYACLDDSFAPAKNGGEGVGLTSKGKGTKWMLVVDGDGIPIGLHLASAQQAEVRLAEQALDTVRVPRTRG